MGVKVSNHCELILASVVSRKSFVSIEQKCENVLLLFFSLY